MMAAHHLLGLGIPVTRLLGLVFPAPTAPADLRHVVSLFCIKCGRIPITAEIANDWRRQTEPAWRSSHSPSSVLVESVAVDAPATNGSIT